MSVEITDAHAVRAAYADGITRWGGGPMSDEPEADDEVRGEVLDDDEEVVSRKKDDDPGILIGL